MSGQRMRARAKRCFSGAVCVGVLLALLAAAPAARAEPSTYVVRGLGGAALWGLGQQMGTEAVAFAFTEATPQKGDPPAAGPRLVFSVTQWAVVNGAWVRRQWYGDVPLEKETLKIALDLAQGRLETVAEGTLEEQRLDGSILRRSVKGSIAIVWVGSGVIGSTTAALTYQSSAYTAILQTVGSGRQALASAGITVEGMDGTVKVSGLGSLTAVTDGLLQVNSP